MRTLSAFALLLCLTLPVHAEPIVVPGLNIVELAPPLDAGASDSNSVARNAITGDFWWASGSTLNRLVGNDWAPAISVLQKDGGPIGNLSLTPSLAFDSAGRMYVGDFSNGRVYRSDDGSPGSWSQFADLPSKLDDFQFDSLGNLVALTGASSTADLLSVVSSDGLTIQDIGLIGGRNLAFDAAGNYVTAHVLGDGLDVMTPGGSLSTIDLPGGGDRRFQSIAVTPGGNYLVGGYVNATGPDNNGRLYRVDALSGELTTLAQFPGGPIPSDMQFFGDDLYINGFGSTHALQGLGDFDTARAPEPGTLVMLAGFMAIVAGMARWKRGS